jgi:hypothetical protein
MAGGLGLDGYPPQQSTLIEDGQNNMDFSVISRCGQEPHCATIELLQDFLVNTIVALSGWISPIESVVKLYIMKDDHSDY